MYRIGNGSGYYLVNTDGRFSYTQDAALATTFTSYKNAMAVLELAMMFGFCHSNSWVIQGVGK